jgi:hypothetical protein
MKRGVRYGACPHVSEHALLPWLGPVRRDGGTQRTGRPDHTTARAPLSVGRTEDCRGDDWGTTFQFFSADRSESGAGPRSPPQRPFRGLRCRGSSNAPHASHGALVKGTPGCSCTSSPDARSRPAVGGPRACCTASSHHRSCTKEVTGSFGQVDPSSGPPLRPAADSLRPDVALPPGPGTPQAEVVLLKSLVNHEVRLFEVPRRPALNAYISRFGRRCLAITRCRRVSISGSRIAPWHPLLSTLS